jgi:hypothetical protein
VYKATLTLTVLISIFQFAVLIEIALCALGEIVYRLTAPAVRPDT